MNSNINSRLREILAEGLYVDAPIDGIGLEDNLQSAAGLDSVAFLELRVQCETSFGIEITDADFTPENFATLARLSGLIDRLSVAKSDAASRSSG